MVLYHLTLQMVTELTQTGTPLNRSVMLKFGSDCQGAKRQSFYRRALKPGSRFFQMPSELTASKIFAHPFTDRKSTRLNSSHGYNSYAVFCLKKKKSIRSTRNSLIRRSLHTTVPPLSTR